jgi:hypothetical protein
MLDRSEYEQMASIHIVRILPALKNGKAVARFLVTQKLQAVDGDDLLTVRYRPTHRIGHRT